MLSGVVTETRSIRSTIRPDPRVSHAIRATSVLATSCASVAMLMLSRGSVSPGWMRVGRTSTFEVAEKTLGREYE